MPAVFFDGRRATRCIFTYGCPGHRSGTVSHRSRLLHLLHWLRLGQHTLRGYGDMSPLLWYWHCKTRAFASSVRSQIQPELVRARLNEPQASDFICCTQCGESFHKTCLNASLDSRKYYEKIAARWRCLSCMRCSTCEGGSDDNVSDVATLCSCAPFY